MSILYVLIPMSIVLLIIAIWFFFWASNDGQFDDLDSPAVRILMDDDETPMLSQKHDPIQNSNQNSVSETLE